MQAKHLKRAPHKGRAQNKLFALTNIVIVCPFFGGNCQIEQMKIQDAQ